METPEQLKPEGGEGVRMPAGNLPAAEHIGIIPTSRLEAFSDGVLAILITIMVFDIKIPDFEDSMTQYEALQTISKLVPHLLAYASSFIVIGILWMNHHHLFHLVQRIDQKLIWLNMNLLFWISLILFPTSLLGNNYELPLASALYGSVLTVTMLSFTWMRHYVVKSGALQQSTYAMTEEVKRVNRRTYLKTVISTIIYALSIPLAFVTVWASFVCFVLPLAAIFFPDSVDARRLRGYRIQKSPTQAPGLSG